MKLLLLSEYFPEDENACITGGVESRNYYYAKYASHNLTIFASRTGVLQEKKQLFHARVKFLGFKRRYLQSGDIMRRLFYVLVCIKEGVGKKYDVVEGTNWITSFAALVIGKINQTKIVFWYPDVWIGNHVKLLGVQGFLLELLERFLLFFGKNCRFIAISENTKNKLMMHGIPAENIVVIPCGVDAEELKMRKSVAKIYDLVAVNRLVDYKNTMTIVKIAVENKLTLLIIGDGQEYDAIKSYISENHAQNLVKIKRHIDKHQNLLQEMNRAKIFVSASLVEGFNIAALEAAALGTPCLLSSIPAHLEHAKRFAGILTFANEKQLIVLIKKLLTDRKYYASLSEVNAAQARKYSWKEIISQTEKLLPF